MPLRTMMSRATADAALYLLTGEGDFVGWDNEYPGDFARRSLGVVTLLWSLIACDLVEFPGSAHRGEVNTAPFDRAKRILMLTTASLYEWPGMYGWPGIWRRAVGRASHQYFMSTDWYRDYSAVDRDNCEGMVDQLARELGVAVGYCLQTALPLLAHPLELTALNNVLRIIGQDQWWEHWREQGHDVTDDRAEIVSNIGLTVPRIRTLPMVDLVYWLMTRVERYQQLIPQALIQRDSRAVSLLRRAIEDIIARGPDVADVASEEKPTAIDAINSQIRQEYKEVRECELILLSLPMPRIGTGRFDVVAFRIEPFTYGPVLETLYGPAQERITPYLAQMLT